MVENSGKKTSTGRIRPLNQPVPIQVQETAGYKPALVTVGRRNLEVIEIQETWDLLEEWWRSSPIARRYFDTTLEDGQTVVIFKDLIGGGWYRQKA